MRNLRFVHYVWIIRREPSIHVKNGFTENLLANHESKLKQPYMKTSREIKCLYYKLQCLIKLIVSIEFHMYRAYMRKTSSIKLEKKFQEICDQREHLTHDYTWSETLKYEDPLPGTHHTSCNSFHFHQKLGKKKSEHTDIFTIQLFFPIEPLKKPFVREQLSPVLYNRHSRWTPRLRYDNENILKEHMLERWRFKNYFINVVSLHKRYTCHRDRLLHITCRPSRRVRPQCTRSFQYTWNSKTNFLHRIKVLARACLWYFRCI